MNLQQVEADLSSTRKQYKDMVEENGRQEARLLAVLSNTHSEQDMFTTEIKQREEIIQKVKSELHVAKETMRQHVETVRPSVIVIPVVGRWGTLMT